MALRVSQSANESRVVCHIDLDCFYVQVERRKDHALMNKPCAVVQYNKWKGGAIIALSYEAKAAGVRRNMRGEEARRACPGIQLVTVPVANEKADLTCYRTAGSDVFELLSRQGAICERTSIDEAYIDVTSLAVAAARGKPILNVGEHDALVSHVLGRSRDNTPEWIKRNLDMAGTGSIAAEGGQRSTATNPGIDIDSDVRGERLLAGGAVVAAQLRALVKAELGFTMSAGVAHNKLLAKYASGMHKPFQQTIVPTLAVKQLLADIPINMLNGFGGKQGIRLIEKYGVKYIGDLADNDTFPMERLLRDFGSSARFIWESARGICTSKVSQKVVMGSIECSKTFTGMKGGYLSQWNDVEHYIKCLCVENYERIQQLKSKYNRVPTRCTVGIHHGTEVVSRKGVKVTVTAAAASRPRGVGRTFTIMSAMLENLDVYTREVLAVAKVYVDALDSIHITALSVSATKVIEIVSAVKGGIEKWTRPTKANFVVPSEPQISLSYEASVSAESSSGKRRRLEPACKDSSKSREVSSANGQKMMIDPSFFAEMPDDIRKELLQTGTIGSSADFSSDKFDHQQQASTDVIDESFLAEMPPDIREELLQARSNSNASRAESLDQVEETTITPLKVFTGYNAESVDPEVLANLPPALRREVLDQIARQSKSNATISVTSKKEL